MISGKVSICRGAFPLCHGTASFGSDADVSFCRTESRAGILPGPIIWGVVSATSVRRRTVCLSWNAQLKVGEFFVESNFQN